MTSIQAIKKLHVIDTKESDIGFSKPVNHVYLYNLTTSTVTIRSEDMEGDFYLDGNEKLELKSLDIPLTKIRAKCDSGSTTDIRIIGITKG